MKNDNGIYCDACGHRHHPEGGCESRVSVPIGYEHRDASGRFSRAIRVVSQSAPCPCSHVLYADEDRA